MLFCFNKIFINKYILLDYSKNIYQIPLLKKIILHFGLKKVVLNNKQIIGACLVLNILSNQKCILSYSKKSVMFLKVKKGMLMGCRVTLNNYLKFKFLNNFNITLLNLDKIKLYKSKSVYLNNFTMRFDDLFLFKNLALFFEYFDDLTFLNISFISTQKNTYKTLHLLNTLQLCEI